MDNRADNVETLEINNTLNEKTNEPKKKSNLKWIIALLVLIIVVGVGVYFYVLDDKTKKLEKVMEDASVNYYENYINTNTGAGAYDVTLEMLKDANSNRGENYKLDALKNCNAKKTKAVITIDYVSGEVTGTKITLDCKKF